MTTENDKKTIDTDSERILISFYLSTEMIEMLDDVLFYARKSLPIGKRRKLTKSVVYEVGLKMVIENYHEKGEASLLLKVVNDQI